MSTHKLYDEDSHLRECEAVVRSAEQTDQGWQVVLDRTVFFPEGGGQSCDKGWIDEAPVLDVQEKNGEICHLIETPFRAGQTVKCRIDWPFRFSMMQNHSGEHVVSGLVHARYGYDNVGFHLGSDLVTLDFNGPMTKAEVREIETLANQAVWEDLRITARYPAPEELVGMEYRSKLDLTENVRIVEIEGLDRCACCAPHVRTTGEIGQIRLLEVQNYKGGVRIYMLAGARALEYCQMVQDQAAAIAMHFSTKVENVQNSVQRLAAQYAGLLEDRNRLSTELIRRKAAELPASEGLRVLFVRDWQGEELRIFANYAAAGYRGITMLVGPQNRYILASVTDDVRPLNQELRTALSAKGGGSANMAQGAIPADEAAIRAWAEGRCPAGIHEIRGF